jgi:hypothetical protein
MTIQHQLLPTTMNRTMVQSRATVLTPPSTPAAIEVAAPRRAPHWWSRRRSGEAPSLGRIDQDPGLAASRLFLWLR